MAVALSKSAMVRFTIRSRTTRGVRHSEGQAVPAGTGRAVWPKGHVRHSARGIIEVWLLNLRISCSCFLLLVFSYLVSSLCHVK